MNYQNDDLRINDIKELLPPVALLEKFPATERAAKTVSQRRSPAGGDWPLLHP
jgi:3-deoxy-7-phosphoheptulonate synthase